MAFSPLYHLHHQPQSLHSSEIAPNSNPYFNPGNSSMPFSMTDILHHQAVLSNNLSNYSNGPSSSSSSTASSSLSLSANQLQLEESFNPSSSTSKKYAIHHANSAIITPPSYSSNHGTEPRPSNSNSSTNNPINIIPPCTPSPSIHSPVNNTPATYNPAASYSSFSSTPNTFNHQEQASAALAYLNSYGKY